MTIMNVVEPRCHICRDPGVRRLVNALLDLRGFSVHGFGKITYASILRQLGDRITYDSLRNHAKRHYELDGIAAYWKSRMDKEWQEALRVLKSRPSARR